MDETDVSILIKATGLSNREIANMFGIGYRNLDKMESGKSHTPDNVLRDIFPIAMQSNRNEYRKLLLIEDRLKAPE